MGIILTILKIIGISLAAILGLILLVLLVVLLVPIRYRLSGARSPGDGVLTARGKVSWLASILSVTFGYDQEFTWKIRIFGIPLKLDKKEDAEANAEDMTAENEAVIDALETELAEESKAQSPQPIRSAAEMKAGSTEKSMVLQAQEISSDEFADPSTSVDSSTSTEPVASIDVAEGGNAEEVSEKPPLKDKLKAIWQKITEIVRSLPEKLRSIREKITSIPEKVRSLKQQADTWIQFATSDEVKQLIRSCWTQLKQILRHLLPTKLRVKGHYGFEDPATTGQLTGVLCMLPEKYQKSMDLVPDFNNPCLDGEFFLKGRIRLGSLLLPVIKILLNSNTWRVYKRFRSITKSQNTNITKNDPHKGGK